MAPTASTSSDRLWRRLLLVSAVVTVAPLWSAKYLPFLDLPEHVAAIATLRHWSEWDSGATYTLAITKSQYLAYHFAGALLAVPLGARLANLVLLTAAGLALPYAVRALLRAYGTDERLAILSCVLFWSRPLVIGFLPYVASLPVLVYALALAVRQRREPRLCRVVAIGALAVLLFYLHLSAYAVLVTVLAAMLAVPAAALSRARVALETSLALAPSLACAAVWAASADPRGGPMLLAADRVTYGPRAELGVLFAAWTHDIWAGHADEIAGVAFWLVVLSLGVQRRTAEPDGARGVVERLLPFACVLVLFVALPYRVGAGAMLNVRLSVLLAVFALLVPRPDPGRRSAAPLLCGVALTLFVASTAFVKIREAERELGDFDAVLAHIRPGARLLALHFERASDATHGASFVHVGAYHRLQRGGVASLSFSEMAHWPIQYRDDARPPRKSNPWFWDFEPCRFRNSVDGAYFDVVLSRGQVDPFAGDPPGPSWRRLAVVDRWRVDEKIAGTWQRAGELDPGPCP